MSSMQEVLSVKTFLEQKSIVTSTDWVEACVNFVKQEHVRLLINKILHFLLNVVQ